VALRYRELHDEDWLRQRYELERRSTYKIAAELGCDDATVSRALRRFGIKGRLGRPAAVKPGEVYGRLTVIAELAERDRGGRSTLSVLAASGASAFTLRASATSTSQPAAASRSLTQTAPDIISTQAFISGPSRPTRRTRPPPSAGIAASAVSSPRSEIAHHRP
jgi:hypothetical protein